jgi:hypothetical protein
MGLHRRCMILCNLGAFLLKLNPVSCLAAIAAVSLSAGFMCARVDSSSRGGTHFEVAGAIATTGDVTARNAVTRLEHMGLTRAFRIFKRNGLPSDTSTITVVASSLGTFKTIVALSVGA